MLTKFIDMLALSMLFFLLRVETRLLIPAPAQHNPPQCQCTESTSDVHQRQRRAFATTHHLNQHSLQVVVVLLSRITSKVAGVSWHLKYVDHHQMMRRRESDA